MFTLCLRFVTRDLGLVIALLQEGLNIQRVKLMVLSFTLLGEHSGMTFELL